MTNKEKLLLYILEYLKLKIKDFKIDNRGKQKVFNCPICNQEYSCILIPNVYKVRCFKCNKTFGNIFDLVKLLEEDKKDFTEEQLIIYLRNVLNLQEIKTDNELENLLSFYQKNNFDLVPVARGQKNPIEQNWTNKNHTDRKEWEEWISSGINIGVKTGKISNITIIDIDTSIIPEDIKKLLDLNTCYMKTNKGFQYFYKYTDSLPNTRIDEYKLDILNDGKQSVIPPSIVDSFSRQIFLNDIKEIPENLRVFLKSKITVVVSSFSDRLKEDIKADTLDLNKLNLKPVEEGNRNSFLLHFGGILRKELNITQTGFTLHLANKLFCRPQLSLKEVDNIVNSLDRYITHDENELALKILQYMKIVEEASSRDIREALGEMNAEGKQRIEKAIKFLIKEGFLLKKRREFHLIKRAEWKEQFVEDGRKIDFIMPYFDDFATFRNSDMAIIGAKTGSGKTHLAMNIIKNLVLQGKKPCYISLESGSRFVNIAMTLGLKEGDFKWCIHFNPADIELEENAITIIDWLLPDDYAMTDKLYKYFAEQLVKKGGVLIVFAQLMQNNDFFAKNMIDLFPSFVAKFVYEDETGVNSYFQITKIREPRTKIKSGKIPCIYDFESKELKMIDEKTDFKKLKVKEEVLDAKS